MKCPFLIKRRDVYDDGKKIDEEIELLECMKNECMVYDSATKLCSLLSSNMKTGVLIEDYKKGVKEVKEEIFQRAEALREGVSESLTTMQEGLLGRLDVQKKQIEVMILGFQVYKRNHVVFFPLFIVRQDVPVLPGSERQLLKSVQRASQPDHHR